MAEQKLKRINELETLLYKWKPLDRVGAHADYISKYASKNKLVKGKLVKFDERTGRKYDKSVASKYILKEKFGTETPQQDLKYLKALKQFNQNLKGTYYNNPLREKLSKKLVQEFEGDPSSVYAKKQQERIKADQAKLDKLKQSTSFKTEKPRDAVTRFESPYITDDDRFIPNIDGAIKRTDKELQEIATSRMLTEVGKVNDSINKKPVPYESSNRNSLLSSISDYADTTPPDISYEGELKRRNISKDELVINNTNEYKRTRSVSGTPLPADKVWEQNYGKRWALMTKHERKAAKRDLRINAGE